MYIYIYFFFFFGTQIFIKIWVKYWLNRVPYISNSRFFDVFLTTQSFVPIRRL